MKRKTRAELEAEVKRLKNLLQETDYQSSRFIGSGRKKKKIKHFHRPTCTVAIKYLLKSKNPQWFDSHQEAVDAGYKPCKTCRA